MTKKLIIEHTDLITDNFVPFLKQFMFNIPGISNMFAMHW